MIRERILKLSATDCHSGPSTADIEIEVPSEQDGCIQLVPPDIFQGLVKLRTAQQIIPFAFQVQVVGDDCFPGDVGIADQRQAAPYSFLKWINFWKEPARAPEIGLLLESEDAGV